MLGNGMTIWLPGMDASTQPSGGVRGSSSIGTSTGSNPASTVSTPHIESWPQSPPPVDLQSQSHQLQIQQQQQQTQQARGLERTSFRELRASFRGTASNAGAAIAAIAHHTVTRAVTPEPSPSLPENRPHTNPPSPKRHHFTSPRVGGVYSRQRGDDGTPTRSASPPPATSSNNTTPHHHRPRNRTMDASSLRQHMSGSSAMAAAIGASDNRHRVGSVSSSGSQSYLDDIRFSPQQESTFPPVPNLRPTVSQEASTLQPPKDKDSKEKDSKDKESKKSKKQSKRPVSRPPSPVFNYPPQVDSLPVSLPTENPNKIMLLMKNMCGRMRGEIEYQFEIGTTWIRGVGYIDEERGSLMLDPGPNGNFHTNLVPDLRGCQIMAVDYPGMDRPVLELVCAHPQLEVLVRPLAFEETDLWVAAFLCWQQLRPTSVKMVNGKPVPPSPSRVQLRRHTISLRAGPAKTSIIKMGNVKLWDKGLALTPRTVVKRSSTRDNRSPACVWRRVPCTLHENGELRLLSDRDGSILTTIELAQLSRCAVQHLDKTVLDEEHCIGIFPIYHSTSTQLSIFRPVFLSLDSRENFEVWFVLLRAFALPDVFQVDPDREEQVLEIIDLDGELAGEIFRIEKSINVRVTEAKLMPPSAPSDDKPKNGDQQQQQQHQPQQQYQHLQQQIQHQHLLQQQDSSLAFMAEVMLDGEVRSKTTIKTGTRNPFWRDEAEFSDLPPMTPFYLSVLLKRVEGFVDGPAQQQPAPGAALMRSSIREVAYGALDIPLERLENGKDHEQWLQIYDEKQKSVGSMLIKIHHDELVVLMANEYRALSELLHRFPAGLTSQITAAIPGQLRRISGILLNIFQASRTARDWLQALVEEEMDGIGNQSSMAKYGRYNTRLKSADSAGAQNSRDMIVRDLSRSLTDEANLLFRGNSLLTQSLEFYMRRLGKEYLEEALRDKLHEINDLNPDCEVDPSRMAGGGNSNARPDEEVMSMHWSLLLQLTTEVWGCIMRSAGRLPDELRSVLKYVRFVAEGRYGNFLRTVAYTAVSGFLFLRFICPAILSPKLFGLLRDHPRPRAQRTLTIIAKALQKLANVSTFGKREEWMEPMNKFLNANRNSFRDFVDTVCSLPLDRPQGSTPAQYSAPATILNRLPPIRREGFPSLPHLIDNSRSYAALVKVWTDSNPLAGAIAGNTGTGAAGDPDSDLRLFNDMCVELQGRADGCLARVEALRSAAERSAVSTASSSLSESSQPHTDEQPDGGYEGGSASLMAGESGRHGDVTPTFSTNSPPSWAEAHLGPQHPYDSRPPGSAGSDIVDVSSYMEASAKPKKDKSRGRAQSSVVGSSSSSASALGQPVIAGTTSGAIRASKASGGGKTTRMLLSGIMRMGVARPSSPDHARR